MAFDLEDCAPLQGYLERVQEFYDLGVRTLVPTYNIANCAGGGCLDECDQGLTSYGRDLVAELNRVGMGWTARTAGHEPVSTSVRQAPDR